MRCKVFVKSLAAAWNGGVEIEFQPVQGDSEENKKFHNATPSGSFRAQLSKEAAHNLESYRLGKEYYVDFTPV